MADTKISALAALTGAGTDAAADVLPIVDTSATATKKIVVNQLAIAMAASQADVDAGTNTSTLINPFLNRISLGTEQSASGTAVTFTGIPSGTRRITIMLAGVSSNGSSNLLVQLGDSGGIENTGYSSSAVITNTPASAQSTAGLVLTVSNADAIVYHGMMTLSLEDSSDFTWVGGGTLVSLSGNVCIGGGSKALSAELTQVRVTTVNGTDAFDAGVINIQFER